MTLIPSFNLLYVDKTRYLYDLVKPGAGTYFLARPRRFGKSLMISTLEEIFLGNRALFKDLWIDSSDYDWQTYSIIRIDFSANAVTNAANLEQVIDYYVEGFALQHGLKLRGFDYQSRFGNLIEQLASSGKQVVLLIDEYDKPLIDNLTRLPQAVEIRNTLKNFYTVIKALDPYICFIFVTGVSKFAKVGIFSAMNNLDDLTMDPRFATALGITEAELTRDFAEYIADSALKLGISTDTLLAQMREWYSGFCFAEQCEHVYNPSSTIQFLRTQRLGNYWFESGTPTFLTKMLHNNNYNWAMLKPFVLKARDFDMDELENPNIVHLLFQTGYLTIKDTRPEFGQEMAYFLAHPNREVENAFLKYFQQI